MIISAGEIENINSLVTFTSSNPNVMTVDADGNIQELQQIYAREFGMNKEDMLD